MAVRRGRAVVLVVDDNTMVRETLQAILEEHFDVLDAPDGRSAVELARAAHVDAVVLDIVLPDIHGLAVLAQLHAVRPGLPVVILSALNNAATAAEAMRRGAVDYLTKPFENEALLNVVREALRGGLTRRGLPPDPAHPSVATVGCPVDIAAGLAATLATDIEVLSHRDLSSAEEWARLRTPLLFVLDTRQCRLDWIDHAALLLDRFPRTPAVILVDADAYFHVQFVLGERCCILQRPFRLAALLDRVCTGLPDPPVRRPWRDPRTADVIEAVRSEYAAFRLSRLARRMSVSPNHLSRWFRAQAGLSVRAYVTRFRVYAARHLIEQGDTKIEAVVSAVGFHDASHLSRRYVEVTGHRPGQYRRAR